LTITKNYGIINTEKEKEYIKMTFTKRELELLAKACLMLAADKRTNDTDTDILDELNERFERMVDDVD
jgi:hypothetical protein